MIPAPQILWSPDLVGVPDGASGVEIQSGLTARRLIAHAHCQSSHESERAILILERLAPDYERGHGLALVHLITAGPRLPCQHICAGGTRTDVVDDVRLDGTGSNRRPDDDGPAA